MVSFIIVAKDDLQLEQTLHGVSGEAYTMDEDWETVVIDASSGRLDHIRAANPHVRWFDYEQPADRKVTIAAQRNLGVSRSHGELIVFIDASCVPDRGWLSALIEPLRSEAELLAAGSYRSAGKRSVRDEAAHFVGRRRYLDEAPTLNLAVARRVFELIGGFDESFDYGSDVDFTWRAVDAGLRIRYVPKAVVAHDWGTGRSDLRRSFRYGQARYRLYAKHPARLRDAWRREPEVVAYPLFLLISPLAAVTPWVATLLAIPFVKNLRHRPLLTIIHHLIAGAGVVTAAARGRTGHGPRALGRVTALSRRP